MNIRVYNGADGRYIHADDLMTLLQEGTAVADPVTAVVLPRIIKLVDAIRNNPGEHRPWPT